MAETFIHLLILPLTYLDQAFTSPLFTVSPSGRSEDSPRPSIAPKPTIDLRHVRQNPELYFQNCLKRNYKVQSDSPFKIVKLFEEWQALQRSARSMRERNNNLRTKLSHGRTFSGQEGDNEGPTLDRIGKVC
jgi:seryl-tRNA synthetase